MLFQSSVPQLFNKIGLEFYTQTNQARKTETAKRLNFYHDYQIERLEEQLNELFSEPDSMIKTTLNIVKKIIVNLAQTYRESPTRTLDGGSEADQTLYAEILEQSAFDIKMKQASRYCKLLKTILIRPLWRNEKIELDIYTGNLLDIETSNSPEQLEKVLITDYGKTGKIEDISYSLWTSETWSRLDYQGNILEQETNPYQVLPFLPIFDFPPVSSSFWLPGGADLISLQEAINIKLTDLIYLLQMQSFGVGFIKGSQGGGSLRTDPGSLVELPENGSIGFESQKAEIDEVVNAIDKLIKWACVSNGLSAASMSTDPQKQSGISKAYDSKELAEMRTDDIALWRSYEHQIFNLMRIVHNVHSTKKLSESATLSIDFADPSPELDAKSQAQAWDLELAMGIISQVDIAMEKNPDLKNREDALAFLMQVKEETRQLSE